MKLKEIKIIITKDAHLKDFNDDYLSRLCDDVNAVCESYLQELKNELEAPEFACKVEDCAYQRMKWLFYNAGGALPCMQCKACIEDCESLKRLKQWNRDTDKGADPRR